MNSTRETSHLAEPKIVCPHCWANFYQDEAKYIATHPKLYGDDVLGDAFHRRLTKQEVNWSRDGVMSDPQGGKVTEQACPVCHLQIPPDVLSRRPIFISLVGAPRSGKTYFLTSLVNSLRNQMDDIFGYALIESDSHDVKAFLEYERRLFDPDDPNELTYLNKTEEQGELYNRPRIQGVDVLLPKPFIFSMRPLNERTRKWSSGPRSIVVYDNAGESFELLKELQSNSRVTQHLAESDVVLFAYDPLQEPRKRHNLDSMSDDPQVTIAHHATRQEYYLQEVVNRIRRHGNTPDGQRLKTPLCICVQKYDVWKSCLSQMWSPSNDIRRDDGRITNPIFKDPVVYSRSQGAGGIDLNNLNMMSWMLRRYCAQLNPQLVRIAEASFETVRYFPVSALGTSPEYDTRAVPVENDTPFLKVRPNSIAPFRVTAPMLWLLNRMRLIPHTNHRQDLSRMYPAASVQLAGNDRIHVQLPTSGASLEIEASFASGLIVAPDNGEVIWIPAISGGTPVVDNSIGHPKDDQVPQADSLKLRLERRKDKSKRGWRPWSG